MGESCAYEPCTGTVVHSTAEERATANGNYRIYLKLKGGPFGISFMAHESVGIKIGDQLTIYATADGTTQQHGCTTYVGMRLAPATGVKFRKRASV